MMKVVSKALYSGMSLSFLSLAVLLRRVTCSVPLGARTTYLHKVSRAYWLSSRA